MEGGAAGSLGPADLEEIGIRVAAVNTLEIAIAPGLQQVRAMGGLARFFGWDGPLVAVSLRGERAGRGEESGWRARRLPAVVKEVADELTVVSPVDGSTHRFSTSQVEADAADLGAATMRDIAPSFDLQWWRSAEEPIPSTGWVVSSVPADAARAGHFWGRSGWCAIASFTDAAAPQPMLDGCPCRGCTVAGIGYLAHLWRQREITATHLLGWHNTWQARSMVEDG
ncbi:MAG: hypothetical protein ABR598_07060 [Candidatus Dormibacteria bacterium]